MVLNRVIGPILLMLDIKLWFNSVSAQDISVFDNIDEILPRLPDLENEELHVTTENFRCSCRYYHDGPCSSMFLVEEFEGIWCCYFEMNREELDIAILAQLSCGMHLSDITLHGRKEGTQRKAQRTDFFYHGQRICRDTFKYMHGIGQDKLNALIRHYKVNGITPRRHGNAKRLPSNALKMEDNAYIAHFLLSYAETHGMHLPG